MNILSSVISKIDVRIMMIQFVLALAGCFLIGDSAVIFGVILMMWANNLDYKK